MNYNLLSLNGYSHRVVSPHPALNQIVTKTQPLLVRYVSLSTHACIQSITYLINAVVAVAISSRLHTIIFRVHILAVDSLLTVTALE